MDKQRQKDLQMRERLQMLLRRGAVQKSAELE